MMPAKMLLRMVQLSQSVIPTNLVTTVQAVFKATLRSFPHQSSLAGKIKEHACNSVLTETIAAL